MWLIENPISNSYFDVKWNYEQGRIFCCTKLTELKNMLGMIKAFVLIKHCFPNASLRIAGSTTSQPAYFARCQRAVKEAGLKDKVHFLGSISTTDVQTELSKANCFVLPSFQEAAPLVVEEAMAVGVPVVASRVGGVPYMVKEGETGYLIDPYKPDEIADSVSRILSDDELAVSMSQQSRQIAKSRFAASVVSEKTLEVYRNILELEDCTAED